MRSPTKLASEWLERPQVTNREALTVGVVGGVLTFGLLYGVGATLRAVDLIDFNSSIPVWLGSLVAGLMLAAGLLLGARKGSKAEQLREQIADLEVRTHELATYQTYAEHLRDALADLRKVLAGELLGFSLRDFVEGGLFEPAQRLLGRSGTRGDIRFSILHADGDDFVMSDDRELFPALGHSLEGRRQFRMPIIESFSLHAYQHGKTFASGHLSEDDRFTPHERASRPYESLVSIPLWKDGEVVGVLNVVATEPEAFNAVDRSYLGLLGPIIDVARASRQDDSDLDDYEDDDTDIPIDQEPNDGPAELPPGPASQ